MKELHQLIHALSSSQWQALEKFLTCFSSNQKSQAWQLAKHILKTEKSNTTAAEYSQMLYGKKNEEALKRLALNLRHKILECIASTSCSANTLNDDDREVAVTKLRRKVLQYNFLSQHLRGMALTRSLLDEIIQLAKDYEQYAVLTEHLQFKNWEFNLREGEKQFEKTQKEIDYYERMKQNYTSAYNFVARLNMAYEFSGKADENKILALLEKAIPEVKSYYDFGKSPVIYYYLKVLEMDYHMITKNNLKARQAAFDMIVAVKGNKSVFTKARMSTAYGHLSTSEMLLGRFENAVVYTRHALEYLTPGSYNYALSKQWEFYALFFSKQYSEAEKCARQMIQAAPPRELGEFKREKFYLLLANIYFKNKKHNDALLALENKIELKEDKGGWEFNRRLLQIMTNIELHRQNNKAGDTAAMQIEGLKNLFRNNEAKTYFTPRQKTIYKFLSLACQKGFRFELLNGKAYHYTELLSSSSQYYEWQILSSELIPFHCWAKEQLKSSKSQVAVVHGK